MGKCIIYTSSLIKMQNGEMNWISGGLINSVWCYSGELVGAIFTILHFTRTRQRNMGDTDKKRRGKFHRLVSGAPFIPTTSQFIFVFILYLLTDWWWVIRFPIFIFDGPQKMAKQPKIEPYRSNSFVHFRRPPNMWKQKCITPINSFEVGNELH